MLIEALIIGIVLAVMLFGGGIAVGGIMTKRGFMLGFKASYEIRKGQADPEDKGLFPAPTDPAEFGLIDEQDKGET